MSASLHPADCLCATVLSKGVSPVNVDWRKVFPLSVDNNVNNPFVSHIPMLDGAASS